MSAETEPGPSAEILAQVGGELAAALGAAHVVSTSFATTVYPDATVYFATVHVGVIEFDEVRWGVFCVTEMSRQRGGGSTAQRAVAKAREWLAVGLSFAAPSEAA